MSGYGKKAERGIAFDPRTKIVLLLICIITASMAPSLPYTFVLVMMIGIFGLLSGKIKYSLIGVFFFGLFYGAAVYYQQRGSGMSHTMLLAWLGLFFKVYPCGMMAGIILSTTKVNEFLSAMSKAHISPKIVIPLAVMIRYIPAIREDWDQIRDAMQLREIYPSVKGFITRPAMTIGSVYVPLLMMASKAADELAIAAVTRGIENPQPRTCLVQISFRIRDGLIIGCFAALFIGGRFL